MALIWSRGIVEPEIVGARGEKQSVEGGRREREGTQCGLTSLGWVC